MFDVPLLVTRLGGVARGVRLQEFGVTRQQIAAAVAAGRVDRIRPGLFATSALSPAARAAVEHGGALTCGAALREHGVWVLGGDTRPHVWVGRRGRIREHHPCQCRTHFFGGIPPLSLVEVEIALVHLYRCQGAEAFFASFESALALKLLPKSARARIRRALPAPARWLVDFARSDAGSGLESLLRLRLHLLGLLLECQVPIQGVGRVDFVIDGRLILEVDGNEYHGSAVHRHRDLMRDAAASALGYETLRFDYAQIVHDWPTVQAAILGALRRLAERTVLS